MEVWEATATVQTDLGYMETGEKLWARESSRHTKEPRGMTHRDGAGSFPMVGFGTNRAVSKDSRVQAGKGEAVAGN